MVFIMEPRQAGGAWRGKIHPNAVTGSVAAWMAQYALPVIFAGGHAAGGRFAERWLFQCARTVAQECEAVAGMFAEPAVEVGSVR